jgi:hypothetical protein
MIGNTARHLKLLHPSAEESNDTRRDRVKRVSSWIHPHSHGRTRGHSKKGGKERSVSRLTMHWIAFQCHRMFFYLNKSRKMVTKKYIDRINNKVRKIENDILGKWKWLINGENERFTCNTLKCIEISSRSIKVKGNHYPGDDPEIVAGDRLTPAQEKLAYCEVMIYVSKFCASLCSCL